MKQALTAEFRARYTAEPRVFSAPGRINLIGEHTDYNDGFVLPMAIQHRTWVAAAPRADRIVSIRLQKTGEEARFELDAAPEKRRGLWLDYVEGTTRVLVAAGLPIGGANLLIASNVPMGAGLSSSAALEVAVGKALASLSGAANANDHQALALLCQKAEHEYVGTRCGIMDQFACALSTAEHALLIDCRSLEATAMPFPMDSVRIVVCDTRVRHDLATSEYNQRRAECEAAARKAHVSFPTVSSLRDVDGQKLYRLESVLPPLLYRRARHVVSENRRTLLAVNALRVGNRIAFGRIMTESHFSLRDDYAVSCDELDFAVEVATKCSGVLGARMTGGGFGGSAIALVHAARAEELCANLDRDFRARFGSTPGLHVAQASAGVMESISN